jgi:hypothetical protein
MSNLFAFKIPALVAAACLLSSCISAQVRKVPFDESAFTRYGGSGSGSLTGTAVTTLRDQRTTADHRDTIKLMPVTPYTDEVVQQVYLAGNTLQPPDPRFLKYLREVHPDDNGNFEFRNLPPGQYYVGCNISVSYDTSYSDANDNMTWSSSSEGRWIYQRISLSSGQRVNVSQWIEGK